MWASTTIKRAVRATLAAEAYAYACTETVEAANWVRQVYTELLECESTGKMISLRAVERKAPVLMEIK
eukprot:10279861-Lingulodinium_polyedra.AAC.1